MKNKSFLWSLAVIALSLCGCDKQTKLNTEKIAVLSQKMVVLQQNQAVQLATIQSQLTSLAPMLDKMNDFYFAKSHDDAFFFHTNTLYLLLTVDKKIESRLQVAETERETENSLAYYYHTNQIDTLFFCVAQIQDSLTALEKRMTVYINAENQRQASALNDSWSKQLKLSAPPPEELAQRTQMAADLAQIRRDLELIKSQYGMTNVAAAKPQ